MIEDITPVLLQKVSQEPGEENCKITVYILAKA